MGEETCVACKAILPEGSPIFTPMPCRCAYYCKKCAMKLATGGRCKACKEMFTQFKRR